MKEVPVRHRFLVLLLVIDSLLDLPPSSSPYKHSPPPFTLSHSLLLPSPRFGQVPHIWHCRLHKKHRPSDGLFFCSAVAEPATFAPVCTIRPFTDRDRIDVRPSRRGPFGTAVASVLQTVRGRRICRVLRNSLPQDSRLAITRRRCWTSRCAAVCHSSRVCNIGSRWRISLREGLTVEHHHKSQAAQQPPSRISGPHPLVLQDPAPSPARLITTHPHRANSVFVCQTPAPSQFPLWKVSAPLFPHVLTSPAFYLAH